MTRAYDQNGDPITAEDVLAPDELEEHYATEPPARATRRRR